MQLEAGLGYARVFQAGGISFAAALQRPISSVSKTVRHAVGGSFWYAHTDIASNPADPEGRHLVGIGLRYQLGVGPSASGLFLAVPVQLLHSSIPDRAQLMASVGRHRIPELPADPPVEDQIGSAWGWGAGLELGVRLALASRLSAQTSMQGMYQDIYADSRHNGAWSWHAGLTYNFTSR